MSREAIVRMAWRAARGKFGGFGWACCGRIQTDTNQFTNSNVTPSKRLYLGRGVPDPAKGIHHWLVYCCDRNSGKELWNRKTHTGRPQMPRHSKSTYATESAISAAAIQFE